jgi:hypothetical protein
MANRSDNFNRSAGAPGTPSDGGSAWEIFGGTWLITEYSPGLFGLNNLSGNYDNIVLDAGASNAEVQVTMKTFNSNAALLLRGINSSNFMGVAFLSAGGGNYFRLFKIVSGTYTALHDFTGNSISAGDVIKARVIGNTYTVYKNGVSVGSYDDATHSSGTKYGLSTNETNVFDDFSITDLGGVGAATAVSATTTTPTFSGSAQVSPLTSITVTTALPAFSGGASMASASATVTATTSLPSYSGGATGDTSSGTLTLPVMKNNTGTVLANETGATVHVYAVSTGNKVVTKTGQTTNASGVMTVTDALIVGGAQYRVVVVLGSGAEGLDKVTAS